MQNCNVNIIHEKNHSELHHDHQKKKSFYHLCDSNMASWNTLFYIGFGTSTERAAKGKKESVDLYPNFTAYKLQPDCQVIDLLICY